MPVTLPKTEFPLKVEEIRMFLRDQPNYNILLEDIEFKDEDIQLAMRLTVARYNALTPQTSLTSPAQLNEWILLCGVCCILFRSEGARQLRNQLVTQDGNIAPVGLDEKEDLYLKWSTHFCNEFDEKAQKIKIQDNMESCYGGFGSGYRYIGRWTN
jgi:hypothetical protein